MRDADAATESATSRPDVRGVDGHAAVVDAEPAPGRDATTHALEGRATASVRDQQATPHTPARDAGTRAPIPAAPPPAPVHRRPPRQIIVLPLLLVALAVYLLWPSPALGPLRASGTVEADEVTVASEVAGRIAELSVDEGSSVSAGQVVGRLDDAMLQVQLKQADPAQKQLVEAQLAKLQLKAPLSGVVIKRLARQGEVVGAGAPILTVANPAELKLTLYVRERDLGRVAVGQTVNVSADPFPDRVFPGVVQTIATRAEFTPRNVQTQKDRQNLVFAVKVRVPNPDGALKAGMPVDADFE